MKNFSNLAKTELLKIADYLIPWNASNTFLIIKYIKIKSKLLNSSIDIDKAGVTSNGTTLYIVTDQHTGQFRYFISLKRASMFYTSGLEARGKSIATSYGLDEVGITPGDIIIDCGANYGDLDLYLTSFENVKYVAIEPGKDEIECLKRNISENVHSILFEGGLGNHDEEKVFFYDPNNADSSLIEPLKYDSKYDVKVLKLDTLLNKLGMNNSKIKFLKLEAEGFEPEILEGATQSLKNIEFIGADLGFERGAALDSTAPDVINYLLSNNFTLIKVTSAGNLRFLFKNQNF